MAESSDRDLFVAVDLGAGSGRVMLAGFAQEGLTLREARRFQYPMERREGHLRWPFASIWDEVGAGLRAAAELARAEGRRVRSVGIDTWGVDYGVLDADGNLLEDPICYRDERNPPAMAALLEAVGRRTVFAGSGIQFLVFNTIYQLYAHARAGLPARAHTLLLMPDLLAHRLTGRAVVEHSNATTTQLVDPRTRSWNLELVATTGVPAALFPPIVEAGTDLGPVRPELARAWGLDAEVRVIAPATHDTASAVVGAPLEDGWAYISSGTWSLVGVERSAALLGEDVQRANFTNEGGAYGTVRFLKNVMGLWLFESCRAEWKAAAGADAAAYEGLIAAAEQQVGTGLVFPDDGRLLNPASMADALRGQLRETGQPDARTPEALTRVIFDSLALRYASVVDTIERLTGARPRGIQVVGGGSQNRLLNQLTADATGLPVLAGPVEATALGNALVQAVAAGRFADVRHGRDYVRTHTPLARFEPREGGLSTRRAEYAALEARFADGGA